jgi:hypothetical protein
MTTGGLWQPFEQKVARLLLDYPKVSIIRGKSTVEEETKIWDTLYSKYGAGTLDIMDPPDRSPFTDGLAVFVTYPNSSSERMFLAAAPRYGISINKRLPQVLEPLGLRATPTPYDIPGVDTSRFVRSRADQHRMQTLVDGFESIYGQVHYGTPDDETNPSNVDIDALMAAFREQESGGDYKAIGREVEGMGSAEGAYQFMPSSWDSWSSTYNESQGRTGAMEMTADNQDAVARMQMSKYLKQFNNDIGAVAVAWYAGPGKVDQLYLKNKDSDRSTSHPEEPTIMEYAKSIMGKYSKLKGTVPEKPTVPMANLSLSQRTQGVPAASASKSLIERRRNNLGRG